MELTEEEIGRFATACADPSNTAARTAMFAAGASSATGVMAKILIVPEDEKNHLLALIRAAIRT